LLPSDLIPLFKHLDDQPNSFARKVFLLAKAAPPSLVCTLMGDVGTLSPNWPKNTLPYFLLMTFYQLT